MRDRGREPKQEQRLNKNFLLNSGGHNLFMSPGQREKIIDQQSGQCK
jgi:hypothetical protein